MKKRNKIIIAILTIALLVTVIFCAVLYFEWPSQWGVETDYGLELYEDGILISSISWGLCPRYGIITKTFELKNIGNSAVNVTMLMPVNASEYGFSTSWIDNTIEVFENYSFTISLEDFNMIGGVSYEAPFTFLIYEEELPTYNLLIVTTDGGTTDPLPGIYYYIQGSSVDVTALPDDGYLFDYWLLDEVDQYLSNPLNIVMATNHTATAIFKLRSPTLYVDPEHNNFAVGTTFTINISVTDVTDLTTWQVKIYFNSSLLNCTNAWYPSDHVFAGMAYMPIIPMIDNELGYVLYGCCLIGEAEGFTGSGTLCQIEFEVLGSGNCILHFSEPYGEDTYLWDSNDAEITVTIQDGYFDNS